MFKRIRFFILFTFFCMSLIISCRPFCYASNGGVNKKVVIEKEWRFVEYKYKNPIKVKIILREEVRIDTPENAAQAIFSSMFNLNFEWWLATHDTESQVKLLNEEKKAQAGDTAGKRTRDGWIQGWEEHLLPYDVYLIARADTPDFSIIKFELKSKPNTSQSPSLFSKGTYTFVRKGDNWLSTRTFASHPLPRLWGSGLSKEIVVGRYKNSGKTRE